VKRLRGNSPRVGHEESQINEQSQHQLRMGRQARAFYEENSAGHFFIADDCGLRLFLGNQQQRELLSRHAPAAD
jgi:hypothetical protein